MSISDATWDWIFDPNSETSSSRSRIRETLRNRSSTFVSSSKSWRSSVLSRSVEATRWQSALGSSTLAAASWSSSGRYGVSPMIRANWLCTLRVSASTSGESGTTSGSTSNSPIRYGSSVPGSRSRTRCSPWTRMRSVPSGTLISLCTTATVPTSYTSSQPGGSASTFFTVSRASIRSPATTSSISLIERSWPTASGVIDSGKTTVSFSGRTGSCVGSSSGTTCSSSLMRASRR